MGRARDVVKSAAVAVATASLMSTGLLAGCSASSSDSLPASHLEAGNTDAVLDSHTSCGACHMNAHRGIDGYELSESWVIEDMSRKDFELPDPPPPSDISESVAVQQPFDTAETEAAAKS